MTINYENRLTAYLDIIGWSDAIHTQTATTLYEVLRPIIERGDFNSQQNRDALISKYGEKINPLILEVQFGFFSDCFVLSMPLSMGGRIYDVISEISIKLLHQGFSVRGGITIGDLYHLDQVIFGPALIEAHKIESEQAIVPRVIVDSKAISATGIDKQHALIKDSSDTWVIDIFPIKAVWNDMKDIVKQFYDPDLIINIISIQLSATAKNPKDNHKWKYLASLSAKCLEKYGSDTADWLKSFEILSK